MNTPSILTDLHYAIRQLRQFRDIDRALDALERIQAELEQPPEPEHEACP